MANNSLKPQFPHRQWKALGIVALALILFVVFNAMINSISEKRDDDKARPVARFDVKKSTPKKQALKKKKKKKKKRKISNPQLMSHLRGMSFGMQQFEGLGDFDADSLLGELDDVVMTSDTVDVPPKAVQRPELEFPEEARTRGIQGFVKVSLLINSLGRVEKWKVVESEPDGYFDDLATSNMKSWIFEAAEYKGQKVKVWATATLRFDMN